MDTEPWQLVQWRGGGKKKKEEEKEQPPSKAQLEAARQAEFKSFRVPGRNAT